MVATKSDEREEAAASVTESAAPAMAMTPPAAMASPSSSQDAIDGRQSERPLDSCEILKNDICL